MHLTLALLALAVLIVMFAPPIRTWWLARRERKATRALATARHLTTTAKLRSLPDPHWRTERRADDANDTAPTLPARERLLPRVPTTFDHDRFEAQR